MPSHIIDSAFFKDLFGTAEARAIFSDQGLVQSLLDVEAALARAEGRIGVIPEAAAVEISAKAHFENVDFAEMERGVWETVHPLVPLIRLLESACEGDAGQYVHWGATTQDIMDTAVVLQLKKASEILRTQLSQIENALETLAKKHRDTPMVGRTHGQHAVPITFGFKVAVWLDEWRRHIERFNQACERVMVGQLSGAAGTLASLPDHGLQVQEEFCKELGLRKPNIAWHTARDGFAEWCTTLAMIAATCGKIANEVITLQKNEVGEIFEPHNNGKVGSSTMPHKRNPMLCEAIFALSLIIRGNAGTALNSLIHEHERDMGPWQAEWEFLPETTIHSAGCLALTLRVVEGLEVSPEAMMRNLKLSNGLLCSEALMLSLGSMVGRQRAHHIVYEAAMRAHEEGISLKQAVAEHPQAAGWLSEEAIDQLLDPTQYLGYAPQFVDQVVDAKKTPIQPR